MAVEKVLKSLPMLLMSFFCAIGEFRTWRQKKTTGTSATGWWSFFFQIRSGNRLTYIGFSSLPNSECILVRDRDFPKDITIGLLQHENN